MKSINYDGRCFRSVSNTGNGDVDDSTLFRYHQKDNIVWGTYSGGNIRFGNLIAVTDKEGNLDMRYQHLNKDGDLMTGVCYSKPEIMNDGRIRLKEQWQWTNGDQSKGESVIEEVKKK